jgi:16S rRNA (guanine1207-N2)-methyltransferase
MIAQYVYQVKHLPSILYLFPKKPNIRAMSKDNLPLALLNKHLETLHLDAPVYFDDENDLFRDAALPIKSAIVFLPKSKALIDMTLALISGMTMENGTIVLAGSKKAGIESAKKLYEANIGPVDQKIVGNHSALYMGKNRKLGASKKIEDFISYASLLGVKVAQIPGVFSAGELDEGTKLLLENIPYDKKKILDVGCGSGIIGAVYKQKNPESSVTMCDKSRLAVMVAQKTLPAAEVYESDVFSNVKGAFDLILVNPPFHTGIETDYSFMEKFARDAKKHLNRGGAAYIVANSFLSYQKPLEQIGPTEIIVDDGKFRVFRTTTL